MAPETLFWPVPLHDVINFTGERWAGFDGPFLAGLGVLGERAGPGVIGVARGLGDHRSLVTGGYVTSP
jgi:hypothetical protein